MRYSAWNRRRRAVHLPSWQVGLLLTAAAALGVAFAVVATGVFLIALPIAVLVVIGYRLFGGRRRPRRQDARVVEGEYEIVDRAPRAPHRDRP